jgi:phosphate transport system ATP-binding protein
LVTAIIGPSGCGKSTFLRAINRMNELVPTARTEGELYVSGHDVYSNGTDVVSLRQNVGMVFQRPNPFPKSIYDNIAFGPSLKGIRGSELDGIVEKSLQDAYLWDEVSDKLRGSALSLSGGQQQRLCIARALANDPDVLLMDEPCSALDPRSTKRIEELIAELKGDYTFVIVTHNMEQAKRISDRTAFFHMGLLTEEDITEKIFNEPSNDLTRDYISGKYG